MRKKPGLSIHFIGSRKDTARANFWQRLAAIGTDHCQSLPFLRQLFESPSTALRQSFGEPSRKVRHAFDKPSAGVRQPAEHESNSTRSRVGQRYSPSRTIGVGLVSLVISLVVLFGTVLLIGIITNANVTSKTYGSMQHEVSFDKANIPENEVDRIAYSLRLAGFLDDEVTKYVYVKKVDNDIELYISVVDGIAANNTALHSYRLLLKNVQERHPDTRIYLNLVVKRLDNVVKRMTMGD